MSLELPKIISNYAHIISSFTILRFEQAGRSLKLRATIELVDESKLHIRETIIHGKKLKYAYHWQDKNDQLLIRWDNAPDWDVKTFPHHKHIGTENRVEPSYERTLVQVFSKISSKIKTIKKSHR